MCSTDKYNVISSGTLDERFHMLTHVDKPAEILCRVGINHVKPIGNEHIY